MLYFPRAMPKRSNAKTKPADSTANLGFKATAMRNSANLTSQVTLRSLSETKDNRWLAADSRGEAETAEGNRSNNFLSAAL